MNNPELYQECNIIQKTDALSSLKKYAPILKWKKYNNKIVDLGCGDGSVTNILKEFLPTDYQLLGCDISESMVMFASDHHSNERTTFTLLDIAGDLPRGMTGYFDHVFSFYALNWVEDQKLVLIFVLMSIFRSSCSIYNYCFIKLSRTLKIYKCFD